MELREKIFLSWMALLILSPLFLKAQKEVPGSVMQEIFNEVKTPYKFGLVLTPEDNNKMVDCPGIFREKGSWYMTYVVFDGKGYETWLAQSDNLLNWTTLGRIMSYTEGTWDACQKAGNIALLDYKWDGSYKVEKYRGKYWMSYMGGSSSGYEAGVLGVGIANAGNSITENEWNRMANPVLMPSDADTRWYDSQVIFKSTVVHDKKKTTGYPFVMYYNAKGGGEGTGYEEAERIAMAVSDDMLTWKRYGNKPVIDHHTGISGDAYITRINDVWVMFYFGAFWKPGAFERFACSYNMVDWTDWEGDDLVSPSEPYDNQFAHKPCVIKYKGIVYHFYCAVNEQEQRGISVATSVDMGKSKLGFPSK